MKQLAPGVWRLHESPGPFTNCYLVGDVLVDTGRRWDRKRIFAQLAGRPLSLVALTHVHPDHQGCAHELCATRNLPLACHADDVAAMEGRGPMNHGAADNFVARLATRLWAGPPHPVARVLREGDEVAGFRVIHAPGHAPGEVIFFRDSDRVALCGDVIRNMSFLTTRPGLKEPPTLITYDPAENRRSIRKLAALQPALILPGHGPEVTDMADFKRFVDQLPG